jgi:hypothetical protein
MSGNTSRSDEAVSGRALTRDEIDRGLRLSEFPAVLTVREAAALLRLSESALYHRVGRGEFRGAINGRGKPMRFWRDRLVKEFFSPRNRDSPRGGNGSGDSGGGAGGGNGGWR